MQLRKCSRVEKRAICTVRWKHLQDDQAVFFGKAAISILSIRIWWNKALFSTLNVLHKQTKFSMKEFSDTRQRHYRGVPMFQCVVYPPFGFQPKTAFFTWKNFWTFPSDWTLPGQIPTVLSENVSFIAVLLTDPKSGAQLFSAWIWYPVRKSSGHFACRGVAKCTSLNLGSIFKVDRNKRRQNQEN